MARLPVRGREFDNLIDLGFTPDEILHEFDLDGEPNPRPTEMTPDQRQRMSQAVGFGGMMNAASMEPVYRSLGGIAGLLSAPAAQSAARQMYSDAEHQRWLQEQRFAGSSGDQQVAERVAGFGAGMASRAGSLLFGPAGIAAQQAGEMGATPSGVTDPTRAAIGGAVGLAAGPVARGLGRLAEASPLFPLAIGTGAGSAAYRYTEGTPEEKAAAAIEAATMTGALSLGGMRRIGKGPRTIDAESWPTREPLQPGPRLLTEQTGAARMGKGGGGKKPTKEKQAPLVIEVVKDPVGLRGGPPAPDYIPKSAKVYPVVRSFMKPPEGEPPSLFGVPDHAGQVLGREMVFDAKRDDDPAQRYENWKKPTPKNLLAPSGWLELLNTRGEVIKLGEAPSPEARLARNEEMWDAVKGTPTEKEEARVFYEPGDRGISSAILHALRDPQISEAARVAAGLAGNKNTSPLGALIQAVSASESKYGSELPSVGGLGTKDIAKALRGEPETIGYAKDTQKLPDFFDSAIGKSTRTIMSNDPRGGRPYVVDVHNSRLDGSIDEGLVTRLMHSLDAKSKSVLKRLKLDSGVPNPAQYSRGAARGGEYADYLNKVQHLGRTDWIPSAAQAYEWIPFTRFLDHFTGRRVSGGELPSDLRQHFSRTMAVEVALPDALDDPESKAFMDDLRALVPKRQSEVTRAIVENLAARIEDANGMQPGSITVNRVVPTFWETAGNLAAVLDIVGMPDTVYAAAEMFTALGKQRANFSVRPNPRGETIGFVMKSPEFADGEIAQKAFVELRADLAKKKILLPGGFTPISVGGKPAIVALYKWLAADVEQPKANREQKSLPRPRWVDGKESVSWLDVNDKTKKTYVEEEAGVLLDRLKDPQFTSTIDRSVRAVAKRLGIDLEAGHQKFDARIHDNPTPQDGEGPVSRLRKARRPDAAEMVRRSVGTAHEDFGWADLVRAARDRQRAAVFGAAGEPGLVASSAAPVQPSLTQFVRSKKLGGGVREAQTLVTGAGSWHQRALLPEARAMAEREGIDLPAAYRKLFEIIDPEPSRKAWLSQWWETGFVDRKTERPIDRKEASAKVLDEVGPEAEALILGFDHLPTTGEDLAWFKRRSDIMRGTSLDSTQLLPMVEQAVVYWQHDRVGARARGRYAATLARMRDATEKLRKRTPKR
jgi:hypothetical protein